MSKVKPNIRELVESHTPKNFKYYINLKSEEDLKGLETLGYDLDNLNTIRQPDLIKRAISATYKYYEREVVAHAKKPTIMENGVILNKKMATKTDKKLEQVGVAFFDIDDVKYVAVKLCYELFDIYEIFIMT